MSSGTLVERVDAREHLWCDFLVSLTDEEKAELFSGGTELMLHDMYVNGEISLTDIRCVLIASDPQE